MDDRLKLIGRLKFIRDYECKTNAEIRAMNEAITALSAEPQERKGKWIGDDSQLGIRCSECGTSFNDYISTQDYVYLEGIPSFCPNCGSYNGGEDEKAKG